MLLNNLPAFIFGFFLSAALVTAVLVIIAEARMLGGDENKIKDLCFWMMVAAIIGGRLAYAAANPDILWEDLLAIFRIWEGGVIYYGGLVAAVFEMFHFVKKNNLPLGKTVDILAPGIAVGHFFGWLGCFFAGVCNQSSAWLPWALTKTEEVMPHPIALYIACGHFLIFGFLVFFKNRRKFDGYFFLIYLIWSGAIRSVIEIIPGQMKTGVSFGPISAAHMIGAVSACVGAILLVVLERKRSRRRS